MRKTAVHMVARPRAVLLGAVLTLASVGAATADVADYERYGEAARSRLANVEALAPAATHASDFGLSAQGVALSRRVEINAAPEISFMDQRIAMVQLAQAGGTNDQLSVVRAQPDADLEAIALLQGSVSLSELLAEVSANNPEAVGPSGLVLPLVIFEDARLEIGAGETLELSRPDGAYLANFGELRVEGGRVSGAGPENERVPEFSPFIATSGKGVFVADGAQFEGLGFGTSPVFSGIAVITGGLYPARDASWLVNSVIRDTGAVTFRGSNGGAVSGNAFLSARGAAVSLRGASDIEVSGNLFALSPNGDAIRARDASAGVTIKNNAIFELGTGVTVETGAHDVRIEDNLIWAPKGQGIAMRESDCLLVADNTVIDAGQPALSVRTVGGAVLSGNRVFGTRSAGLFVGNQAENQSTVIRENEFTANRVGIDTAAPDRLVLTGNDFSNQFPKFLTGDLAAQTPRLIGDLTGAGEIILTAGAAFAAPRTSLDCSHAMEP